MKKEDKRMQHIEFYCFSVSVVSSMWISCALFSADMEQAIQSSQEMNAIYVHWIQ